jgi:NhaP-type Na+/H+ or K+/H+ antiporter
MTILADKVFIISAIVFAGILCQWLAWRVKLPAILFLLFTGIVAGPITGFLNSDLLFGDLLFPFISLSVAVILFEGSLTLEYHQIIGLRRVIRNMVTFGVLLTWLITATATHFALHFSWQLSMLFGAITVVTGPTVIVPMLRTIRPRASVASILRWEGIVIDPIGALLAVMVYKFILSGTVSDSFGQTALAFGQITGIGLVLGSLFGYLYGLLLLNHWLPEFLHNVATLAVVFILYAVSDLLHHESGLLSVTVMGIWLANMDDVPVDEILNFKESLSVLLISALFIVLAARLDLDMFLNLGWGALYVFLAIQFLARPLSVVISSHRSKLIWPERHLLAWVAPRGIIAAAISALFAIKLEAAGYDQAGLLVPLTFMVIIGTVVLQSSTAGFIARWLGVAEPDPKGVLIIGANPLARAIAKALNQEGFRALLIDTSWDLINRAKMDGLETYYGEPVSKHADRYLDLVGIGRMLALSPRSSMNSLACMHYRMELGYNAVFALQTATDKEFLEDRKASSRQRWHTLFSEETTFADLATALTKGWKIKCTGLTETFTYEDYQQQHGDKIFPLFAVTPQDKLEIFTAEKIVFPEAGWSIISLVPAEEKKAVSSDAA